jgi:hypothetical protein
MRATRPSSITRKKKLTLSLVTVLLTCMFHLAALFFLQNMQIPKTLSLGKLNEANAKKIEEIRNTQLAEVFESMTLPPRQKLARQKSESKTHEDLEELIPEEVKPVAFQKNQDQIEVKPIASNEVEDSLIRYKEKPLIVNEDLHSLLPQYQTPLTQIFPNTAVNAANLILELTNTAIDESAHNPRNESAGSVASSTDFSAQMFYAASPDQKGYLFQIVFFPKSEVAFKRIDHNIYFMVDRSNSIDNSRFERTKKAITEALYRLDPHDTFNILFFDEKIVKLSEKNLPLSDESLERASKFLETEPHGGFFASTQLYKSLHQIIPSVVPEHELNTAILFTDGISSISEEEQRMAIQKWSVANEGKVALHCVATGRSNNLPLLDLLSVNNRGRLCYDKQEKKISQLLTQLLDDIQDPIGKELVLTAMTEDPAAKLSLFPRQRRVSDLYRNSPFTIYGRCSDMTELTVFIQGKYYDHRFDLQQQLKFELAQKVELNQIIRSWLVHLAYEEYDKFLYDGQRKHISEVKKILRPFNIPVAFP